MSNPHKKHIIVVGAGVTGLTSANFLAEAGYAVTIVAAHGPGETHFEYTSPWAGAHWHTAAKASEPMLCDFDVQTYKYWLEILKQEEEDVKGELPRSGLKIQDSHHFWDAPADADLWYAAHVQDFRSLSTHLDPIRSINARSAPNAQIDWGVAYKSMSLNTPHYLLWLQARGASLGVVTLLKSPLPTSSLLPGVLTAAERVALAAGRPAADAFVNATGLAAGKLCGDSAVHPVRGQTVLVRGEARACRTRRMEEGSVYCIPRPGSGTTILGGTRERGNWNEAPDTATTERILRGNKTMVPELCTASDGGFEVIAVNVGLRPGRDGGPRIEREVLRDGKKVVHSYGHSGAGYQHSVGSARVVVGLMDELLGDGRARL